MFYYYQAIINNNSLVYYIIRNEAKAYSQNTIKSLKTYHIIKSHAVHKYIIYNNYKRIKTK